MNYRRLPVALVFNIALAGGAYWLWRSTRPTIAGASPHAEHPPMEGFTLNTPPEGEAPA